MGSLGQSPGVELLGRDGVIASSLINDSLVCSMLVLKSPSSVYRSTLMYARSLWLAQLPSH